MTTIKFYTDTIHASRSFVLADFLIEFDVPVWGRHEVRGSVTPSRDGNGLAVIWPRVGNVYATIPATREMSLLAQDWIIERYNAWYERGQ